MPQTIAILLPWLIFLAGPVGGGAVASWLFQRIRANRPRESFAQPIRRWWLRWLFWLLHDPLGALLSALSLSGTISIGASVLIAALTGQNLLSAFDAAFAATVGGIASQIAYRAGIKPPGESS